MKTRIIPPFNPGAFLLIVLGLLVGTTCVPAAQLTWDPGLTVGATPGGSGNWDTTVANTNWYNGTIDTDWTQTSTTSALNGAIFGGADGTWAVALDNGQIAVTNITINNSGYAFSGSPIYLATGDTLSVAAGKSATFNCNITGTANQFQYWAIGSGSSFTLGGNMTSGIEPHLVGPSTSSFTLTGANTPTQLYVLGPVNMTSGTLTTSSAASIGYPDYTAAFTGTQTTTGTLTVSGSAVLTPNGNIFFVGRTFGVGGQGTLNVSGGTVNVGNTSGSPKNLAICYDGGSSTESGTVNVNSGVLNVGSSTIVAAINFFETASTSGELATLNQTGGTINAWNGVLFGAASGSYAGGAAALTNSGGTFNIGGNGIVQGAAYNGTISISVSGGTIGALGNWSSSLPMNLDTVNGNITFQCADSNAVSHNISLSGALTGTGGLNETGGGTLTLSGVNNYAGGTTVSNGTLAIVTGATPMIGGPTTLDGTAGSPVVAITVSNPGQYWTNNGALTFANPTTGTPTMSINFGGLAPSTTVAPLQVHGNVVFSTTPIVNISGAAIADGTYPLIKYTGVTNGVMPTTVTTWGGGTASAGYITNIAASKTIALVVTTSSYNPALYWAVGNGAWDINTTPNWKQFSSLVKYTDGNAVIFDDSAAGPSPMTVALNTTVTPLDVTFNNAAPTNYTISGNGNITGTGTLSVLGSGTVTLATTNTYSGGTTLSGGQLNINTGGTPSGTAIGTGTLTINSGTAIDNTSGMDVTLQASLSQTWNGNFTYVGSANNFNTGTGLVTMNNSLFITNGGNNFTVGGNISDNGGMLALSKTGPGALTLATGNSFSGGMTLYSGGLNLGDPSAAGSGVFTIYGGALDNSLGTEFTLASSSYVWAGSFSYLGTTANLDFGVGTVFVPNGVGNVTVDVVNNTLVTFGDINSGNTTVIKSGNGTWTITGFGTSLNNLGLVVNAGQVNFDKNSGQSIGVGNIGLTVNPTGLVLDMNSFQVHSDTISTPVPVSLSGGTWDLNGASENVDKLFLSNGGTLRNGAAASMSTLTCISGYQAQLSGTDCQFDVTASDGNLDFKGVIAGSGTLVKKGLGVLILESNNVYNGNTVISNGTVTLGASGAINNSAEIVIEAGATLDVSAVDPYTLSGSTSLSANGTGAVQGTTAATINDSAASGVVSLGSQPILLLFTPATFTGDTTHPALYISQGALTLNGNAFTVNNNGGTPLGAGTYMLIQVAGGTINSSGSYSVSVTGSGLAGGMSASIQVSGGSVNLVVATPFAFVGPFVVSGSTLTLTGAGGTSLGTYHVYSSPNAAAPLTSWTLVGSSSFDINGNFSFPVTINRSIPAQFYILKEP